MHSMSGDRIARVIRALRHRRDWTQRELGRRGGCSASVISRLEHGRLRACSVDTLERVLNALDGRLVMSVLWRGGELDRLLDADHALLGERWAALRSPGWIARGEVTYNEYGERGSMDDLAFHPASGVLLVTELKTGIYETWRTMAKLDEKARLAPRVAHRFGWSVKRVVPALVVADTRTNRRRIEQHAAMFGRLDCRGRTARAWLRDPARSAVDGLLLFVPLSDVRGTHGRRAGRQRVRSSRSTPSVASSGRRHESGRVGA
jgi:transcriptional regulator with XRE-family HTH domain